MDVGEFGVIDPDDDGVGFERSRGCVVRLFHSYNWHN